jgi:peptidoglycan/LPS O-acetylase OafA/YrhL
LLISQILLRPFFETGTNDLINDWASITYYIIFFLTGFILLQSVTITEAIRKYRFWYLAETIVACVFLFKVSAMVKPEDLADTFQEYTSIFLTWACALTALGFAKQYLNRNNTFRRLANEAIYPFYLLHQPVIIVTGHFIVQLEIDVLWKVFMVLLSSFALTISIYWFIIKPFNLFRIIFGMRRLEKANRVIVSSQLTATENKREEILLSA